MALVTFHDEWLRLALTSYYDSEGIVKTRMEGASGVVQNLKLAYKRPMIIGSRAARRQHRPLLRQRPQRRPLLRQRQPPMRTPRPRPKPPLFLWRQRLSRTGSRWCSPGRRFGTGQRQPPTRTRTPRPRPWPKPPPLFLWRQRLARLARAGGGGGGQRL